MSDANRVQVSYVEESSFGVARAASLQVLRHTGESLKQDTTVVTSEECRSDRQIADIIRTGVGASGGIDFELSYGSHDDFFKAVLCSSGWSTERKVSIATISASAFDNALHDSGAGFIAAGFLVNQWVKISGFNTTANNGWAKIVSVDTDEMVLSHKTLTDEAAGSTITVQMGSQVVNGVAALPSFNIERQYIDLNPDVFSIFLGMCLNSMNLDIPADGIITGSMAFMGSEETNAASSSGTGYSGATSTRVMSGANHVDQVLENATSVGILSFSLSITNNLRQRLEVGNLGVKSMGTGTIEINGSMSLYLTDATLFNKYLNQTETSMAISFQDTVGNGYVVEIPSMKIVNGSRPAGGLNTDVVGEFEWRAFRNEDEGVSIRIARFPVTSGNLAGSAVAASGSVGDLTVT
jgi:hypothetical protein